MVSAIILHYHREHVLPATLDRLRTLPVDEILVVDNGSEAGLQDLVASYDRVRVLDPGANLGVVGRNLAAREAHSEVLLMLDDDAYPLEGAIELALERFDADPKLAVVGGFVRDIDARGHVTMTNELGTFDWFLRAGRNGPVPPDGLPVIFFPEGASFVRRDAFLEVGGYFEPFFIACVELELTTRLVAAGWDVRYVPSVVFDHRRERGSAAHTRKWLYYRIRNQIWYFWLRFPPSIAARRIPAYLAYDLVESAFRKDLGTWLGAVRESWTKRATVRSYRTPLPREVLQRAELNRGRLHVRLLAGQLKRKTLRLVKKTSPPH